MPNRTPSVAAFVLSVAVLVSADRPLQAAYRYWTGAGGDPDWNIPGNWEGGVVPLGGDDVFVNNGGLAEIRDPDRRSTAHRLTLGQLSTHSGTLRLLEGGSLESSLLIIGDAGSGVVLQTGGQNAAHDVVVGHGHTGVGRYQISGGSLMIKELFEVGPGGTGTVLQSGSAQVSAGWVLVGSDKDGDGVGHGLYELTGTSRLSARAEERIGVAGSGRFVQAGGENTTPSLTIDSDHHEDAAYELHDGQLRIVRTSSDQTVRTIIGGSNGGIGLFVQTGGTHQIGGYPLPGEEAPPFDPSAGLYVGKDFGGIYVGDYSPGGGTYRMVSGVLASPAEVIGFGGTGRFEHSGGSNVCGALEVGTSSTGTGTYVISGNAVLNAGSLTIGRPQSPPFLSPTGTFIQSGGEVDVKGTARVLGQANQGPLYTLSGSGRLTSGALEVEGAFRQTGGSNTTPRLQIGSGAARGEYELGGTGALVAKEQIIASGEFIQTGGSNIVGESYSPAPQPFYLYGTLTIGTTSGAGAYRLSGESTLRAGKILLGEHSSGSFEQTGGSVVTDTVSMGFNGSAKYRLVGGTLQSMQTCQIRGYTGLAGTGGSFVNTGGHHIAPVLWVWEDGQYELAGTGQLDSRDQNINGTADFTQSGGLNRVSKLLSVSGSRSSPDGATYALLGGRLEVDSLWVGRDGPGVFRIGSADATVIATGVVGLYEESTFRAVPGSTIHMRGGFFGTRTSAARVSGLSNLTLIFEGGKEGGMEVASRFGGGFDSNFALAGLVLGGDGYGRLRLQDYLPGGSIHQSLFVHSLSIRDDSRLDLAGLAVFVEGNVADQVDAWFRGGNIIDSKIAPAFFLDAAYDSAAGWTRVMAVPIPEPATAATLVVLFGLCRRRYRCSSGVPLLCDRSGRSEFTPGAGLMLRGGV